MIIDVKLNVQTIVLIGVIVCLSSALSKKNQKIEELVAENEELKKEK